MLYRVGDRVVIREDLDGYKNGRYYMLRKSKFGGVKRDTNESNTITDGMYALRGKVFQITSISGGQYLLEDANVGSCRWTDEMFAGLEEDVFGGDIQKSRTPIADFLSPS